MNSARPTAGEAYERARRSTRHFRIRNDHSRRLVCYRPADSHTEPAMSCSKSGGHDHRLIQQRLRHHVEPVGQAFVGPRQLQHRERRVVGHVRGHVRAADLEDRLQVSVVVELLDGTRIGRKLQREAVGGQLLVCEAPAMFPPAATSQRKRYPAGTGIHATVVCVTRAPSAAQADVGPISHMIASRGGWMGANTWLTSLRALEIMTIGTIGTIKSRSKSATNAKPTATDVRRSHRGRCRSRRKTSRTLTLEISVGRFVRLTTTAPQARLRDRSGFESTRSHHTVSSLHPCAEGSL
jgi:hypothetical protein